MNKKLLVLLLLLVMAPLSCGRPHAQQEVLEQSGLVVPSRSSPVEAAKATFEQWAQQMGIPFRNDTYAVTTNDGTFATVLITAEFRESVGADWLEKSTDLQCKNVGGEWQCDRWFDFRQTANQQKKLEEQGKATATAALEVSEMATWKLYATEIVEGEEALQVAKTASRSYGPKEGWKYVTMKLTFENVSSTRAMLPYPGGTDSILVDTGGYERELYIHIPEWSVGINLSLMPTMQVSGIGLAEIPANQSPVSVLVSLDYNEDLAVDEVVGVDLTKPSQPPPAFAAIKAEPRHFLVQSPGDTLTVPGLSATIKSVRLERPYEGWKRARIRVDLKVDNVGGFNLNLEPSNFLKIRGVDDQGHYFYITPNTQFQSGEWGKSDRRNLSPGQTAEGYILTSEFETDSHEALVMIYLKATMGSFFATDSHDSALSDTKAAIRQVIEQNSQAMFEAAKSGNPEPLKSIYVNPVEGDLWQAVTCTQYPETYYETVPKPIEIDFQEWEFPTDTTAIVKTREQIETWQFTCPARKDFKLQFGFGASTYDVTYHLRQQEGNWKIDS